MTDGANKKHRARVRQFAGFNVKEPGRLVFFDHDIRVRYGETDAQGIVYYGSYFAFFEEARVEYMRSLGLNYRDIEKKYTPFVVAEAGCRYRAPAFFDDVLTFRTAVARLGRASITFVYEVAREMDIDPEEYNKLKGISRPIEVGKGLQLVAEGYTTIVAIDNETGRPVTINPSIREPIRRTMQRG